MDCSAPSPLHPTPSSDSVGRTKDWKSNQFPGNTAVGDLKHTWRTTALAPLRGIGTLELNPKGKVQSLPDFFRDIACMLVIKLTESPRAPMKMIYK